MNHDFETPKWILWTISLQYDFDMVLAFQIKKTQIISIKMYYRIK